MDLLFTGFNAFGQWNTKEFVVNGFTDFNQNFTEQINLESPEFLHSDWAYNVLKINSTSFLLSGFVRNENNKIQKLHLPQGASFTNFSCNDKHILFYNKNEKDVWKYSLYSDENTSWSKLPNFLDTESNFQNENRNDAIVKISCGIKMNLVLTREGNLFDIPVKINTESCVGKIIDICCGHEHATLLTDVGNVYSFGCGSRCQLGNGTLESYEEPQLVEALSGIQIIKISAGGWHSCAISAFGDLYTWGSNEKGQLGACPKGDNQSSAKQQEQCRQEMETNEKDLEASFAASPFSELSKHAVNLKRKRESIKKQNEESDTPVSLNIPLLVDLDTGFNIEMLQYNIVDVSCGSKHTIIQLDDGSIWGTGCNGHGQLGFDKSAVKMVKKFTKLYGDAKYYIIKCGIWSTMLFSKKM